MRILEFAIYLGGGIQFSILFASALAPQALDWRRHLAGLPAMLRQLFWVYGAFIVLMIVSFGLLSVGFAAEIAAGEGLGRAVAGLIAVFWGLRLAVQFFVFDAEPFLTTRWRRFGYGMLTVAFSVLVLIYGWAALAPGYEFLDWMRCRV